MSTRHMHLTREMLAHFRDSGSLDLPPEVLDFLGEVKMATDAPGDIAGCSLSLTEKWAFPTPAYLNGLGPDACHICCDTGWVCGVLADIEGNTLSYELDHACSCCPAVEEARRRLPKKFRWVNYRYLVTESEDKVPVAIAEQRKNIDSIQNGDLDGRSVCLFGPSRTGKTVLTSALLHRMVEHYLAWGFFDQYPYHELPIYRIDADEWIAQYEAHAHYQYGSSTPRPAPPELNIGNVDKLRPRDPGRTGECDRPDDYPPVFVVEEIDKFPAREAKVNALFAVLQKVSQAGGMIVSTSNKTKEELRKSFPDHFYRRLVESNLNDDDKLRTIDLFKHVVKPKVKPVVRRDREK
jgi:hypothetical protein